MNRKNKNLKPMALTVALMFTFTTTAWPAPALPGNTITNGNWTDDVTFDSFISDLEIPKHLGSIQQKRGQTPWGTHPTAVIHIQDAHANLEAQKNIAQILEHLKREYNVGLVFLEGASGEIKRSHLNFFDDMELDRTLAEKLVQKGLLGGAALQLLSETPSGMRLFGVEDFDLYQKNLSDFREVLKQSEVSGAFLEDLKSRLITESSREMNRVLIKFFKEWGFYQDNPQQLMRHLDSLKKHAKEVLDLDLENPREQRSWPHLLRYFAIQKLEKRQDLKKAEKEYKQLEDWVELNGIARPHTSESKQSLRAILDRLSPSRTTDTASTPRDLVEQLYDALAPEGFTFQDYPALSVFWGSRILESEIDALSLMRESEHLTDRILESLAETDREKELISQYKGYLLLKKLFSLELTYEEYEEILERSDTILLSVIANPAKPGEAISDLPAGQAGIASSPVAPRLPAGQAGNDVATLFHQALAFYAGTHERDKAMMANMVNELNELNSAHTAVLITGGFHAQGLGDQFEEMGMAYASVTPRISQIPDENLYHDAMMLGEQDLTLRSYVMPDTAVNIGASPISNEMAATVTGAGLAVVNDAWQDQPLPERLARFAGVFGRRSEARLQIELTSLREGLTLPAGRQGPTKQSHYEILLAGQPTGYHITSQGRLQRSGQNPMISALRAKLEVSRSEARVSKVLRTLVPAAALVIGAELAGEKTAAEEIPAAVQAGLELQAKPWLAAYEPGRTKLEGWIVSDSNYNQGSSITFQWKDVQPSNDFQIIIKPNGIHADIPHTVAGDQLQRASIHTVYVNKEAGDDERLGREDSPRLVRFVSPRRTKDDERFADIALYWDGEKLLGGKLIRYYRDNPLEHGEENTVLTEVLKRWLGSVQQDPTAGVLEAESEATPWWLAAYEPGRTKLDGWMTGGSYSNYSITLQWNDSEPSNDFQIVAKDRRDQDISHRVGGRELQRASVYTVYVNNGDEPFADIALYWDKGRRVPQGDFLIGYERELLGGKVLRYYRDGEENAVLTEVLRRWFRNAEGDSNIGLNVELRPKPWLAAYEPGTTELGGWMTADPYSEVSSITLQWNSLQGNDFQIIAKPHKRTANIPHGVGGSTLNRASIYTVYVNNGDKPFADIALYWGKQGLLSGKLIRYYQDSELEYGGEHTVTAEVLRRWFRSLEWDPEEIRKSRQRQQAELSAELTAKPWLARYIPFMEPGSLHYVFYPETEFHSFGQPPDYLLDKFELQWLRFGSDFPVITAQKKYDDRQIPPSLTGGQPGGRAVTYAVSIGGEPFADIELYWANGRTWGGKVLDYSHSGKDPYGEGVRDYHLLDYYDKEHSLAAEALRHWIANLSQQPLKAGPEEIQSREERWRQTHGVAKEILTQKGKVLLVPEWELRERAMARRMEIIRLFEQSGDAEMQEPKSPPLGWLFPYVPGVSPGAISFESYPDEARRSYGDADSPKALLSQFPLKWMDYTIELNAIASSPVQEGRYQGVVYDVSVDGNRIAVIQLYWAGGINYEGIIYGGKILHYPDRRLQGAAIGEALRRWTGNLHRVPLPVIPRPEELPPQQEAPAPRSEVRDLSAALLDVFPIGYPNTPAALVATADHVAEDMVAFEIQQNYPELFEAVVEILASQMKKEGPSLEELRLQVEMSFDQMRPLIASGSIPVSGGGVLVMSPTGPLSQEGVAPLYALYLLELAGVNTEREIIVGGENRSIRDAIFSKDNELMSELQKGLVSQVLTLAPAHHPLDQAIRNAANRETLRNVISQTTAQEADQLAEVLEQVLSLIGDEEIGASSLTTVEKAEALFARTMLVLDVVSGVPIDAVRLKEDLNYQKEITDLIAQKLNERLPDIQVVVEGRSIVLTLDAMSVQLKAWQAIEVSA